MSINGPVQEVDKFVLDADDVHTLGVEIVGHVIVTLDVKEGSIGSQEGVTNGTILEVSPQVRFVSHY